jgi:transcription initiation factor TFIID subunit TAF12
VLEYNSRTGLVASEDRGVSCHVTSTLKNSCFDSWHLVYIDARLEEASKSVDHRQIMEAHENQEYLKAAERIGAWG